MRSKYLIYLTILLIICCKSLSSIASVSQAYLQQVPFDTMLDLYRHHADAKSDPTLPAFADFFQSHQDLFRTILQRESAVNDENYVFYRGVNGGRLVFDTIRTLYALKHGQSVPDDFIFFRDPDDPQVRMDKMWPTLMGHWPLIEPEEKVLILKAVLSRDVPIEQVDLIWSVLWGDLIFERDLTHEQQLQVQALVGDKLTLYKRYFNALKNEKWRERHYPEEQKQRIAAIYRQLENMHQGALIGLMRELDYNTDYFSDFRLRNIAVNLSLFSGCVNYTSRDGLYPSKDECTPLYWYATDLGYHRKLKSEALRKEMLESILRSEGIPVSEVKELEKIYRMLEPVDDQLLFQIVVPKRMLKDAQGKEQPFLDTFFYLSHKLGRPAYYLGPVRPSKLLEVYQSDPGQIPGFLQLQGRFIFTNEGLLSPDSGVRMYTYYLPGASKERIARYKQKLREWAEHQLVSRASKAAFSLCRYNSNALPLRGDR